ncbi:MAG: hypothetical protein AAF151_12785 [Cyanobacteria bacterium J06656_5]
MATMGLVAGFDGAAVAYAQSPISRLSSEPFAQLPNLPSRRDLDDDDRDDIRESIEDRRDDRDDDDFDDIRDEIEDRRDDWDDDDFDDIRDEIEDRRDDWDDDDFDDIRDEIEDRRDDDRWRSDRSRRGRPQLGWRR